MPPGPTAIGNAIVRGDLSAVLWEYAIEKAMAKLIGLQVMPIFETAVKGAGYPIIPTEEILKLPPDLRRNPDGSYKRGAWQFTRGTFLCEERGFEEPVSDADANLYQDYFDVEEISGQIAAWVMMLNWEKRILDMLQDTSVFSEQIVATAWTTIASATPALDVNTHRQTLKALGIYPNALVVSQKVFHLLKLTADVRSCITYVTGSLPSQITKQLLAQYFEVEHFLVSDSAYDSAAEGQSTSMTPIMADEYAWLGVIAEEPMNLKEPCVGRTFLYTQDSPEPLVTETYREEVRRGSVVRVRHDTDERYVMQAAGKLIDTVKTS